MKVSKHVLICLIILTIFISIGFILTGFSSNKSISVPKVDRGFIDLSDWNFNKDGNINLDGEWELYWKQFLKYKDLNNRKPDIYADVPIAWNTYKLNNKNLPGEGYATYRLHVKTKLPKGYILTFRVHTLSSAYALYVNEKKIGSSGKLGTNASSEIGKYNPQTIVFTIPSNEFDIILHISNFHYSRGGFWESIYIGTHDEIHSFNNKIIGKEIFLIGVLSIISLFYFAIYFLNTEFKYTFYFALMCLFILVSIDMVGEFFILKLFNISNFSVTIFLWYISTIVFLFFLIFFVSNLFPSKFSKVVEKISLIFLIFSCILYGFTQPIFYTKFGHISNYLELTEVVLAIIIVSIGIKNKKHGSWLNLISIIILLITYIHDILYWTNVINHRIGEILFIGIFLFILIQMIIQAQRIRLFYNQKIDAELAFLQAQIKPHFLFNALNTFISISYFDIEKARNLLVDFSQYLRQSFDIKSISQFTLLKNEIELCKAYIEIEKSRFQERLEIYFDVPEDQYYNVPILMLQPLIENAIMHGVLVKSEGGRIDISIKKENRMLIFNIKDTGVGMDTNEILKFDKFEHGKGVGIVNIDSRLKKLYGKGLQIISSPEDGTEITWHIPINSKHNF